MKLSFVPKDAYTAYVSNRLWLPKAKLRKEAVKGALEFVVPGREGQEKLAMWDESSNHIIAPREFLPPSDYTKYKFPFVDLRPRFQRVFFEDLVQPRDQDQAAAWQALAANDNGILQLGCGKGKTKLSQKKIAQRGVPTLVIVPDGGMLDQWKKSILGDDRTPPGLRFEGELGIIQGGVFDWAKPLTLALVSTLALRIRDGAVPEEMFRYFGLVVYDEVHQIGAPMFSLTAAPFYGDRIGLTATVEREDGLDPIYRYHIGEPFYSDLRQDLIPEIIFQKTPVTLDYEKAKINGVTNVSILRTMLGTHLPGNVYRYWEIKKALDEGRKILVLGHSKNQLRLFHAMFPGSGLIVSETKTSQRLDILRNSQICFAIARLGAVGVDDDRLDHLFWLTSTRSLIHLQQSIGRVQRSLPGKKQPRVTIFEDYMLKTVQEMCKNIKATFRKWNFHFENRNPTRWPTTLPPDIQRLYDAEFERLPRDEDDGE